VNRPPMDGIRDSMLPLCGNIRPVGVGLCGILPLLPSHAKALYRPHQSILLPHSPMVPLAKTASPGIVEDGLRDVALGAPLAPLCNSPLDSGARPDAAIHCNSEQFVPFAASTSSRGILSGKFTYYPDPPFDCRTKI
jgi:hypothetical protein